MSEWLAPPLAEAVEVRRADAADWPRIWPLWRRIVSAGETHPYPLDATEEDAIALWLRPPRAALYVAERDGVVVAAMQTKPLRYGHGDHIANFDLMVTPECWGHGVGRALAEYVIDACRAAGYAAMEAYAVVAANERAVRLWHGLGFETLAIVPRAFRHPTQGLVDVHHMYRSLT
ncbi:GNAT family N-acetyltransferase [Burkholderia sp. FERM BP-3421]|jgi:GNAT superfamily N-acetyltransferase|uniref:GNAT family N-acetyltransferase n=1 Tax=Burkholderia sp. FERM BP-3421 TaxID=1494466 RepID=UPI002361D03A|nr:GNAT family N-acetyltransferase [Burkholderia sp. FERM BP-3421]WDD95004.1 GNAT family N-acetyltransferase [Burkholderia sp. FERM BP-3421]